MARLLTETAKSGPPRNKEKFKQLEDTDGLYEFKTSGGMRILCFWDDNSLIICSHGFMKKKQKTPVEEITRAESFRSTYFNAKKFNTLSHG
jgi:phage-related protein